MATRCYGCMQQKQNRPVCEHCGYDERTQNQAHQLPAGTMLRAQYRIGRVLGQGGFGITYLGFDENLNIPVAIKEYFPTGMVSRTAALGRSISVVHNDDIYRRCLDRFIREAQLLARLDQTPGIVKVKAFFLENGTAYIVMEYLRGMDLHHYTQKLGRLLSPGETLAILGSVMDSLQAVHEAGLVHRDISPDNIMMMENGQIKLLDFGTARDLEEGSHSTSLVLKQGFAPLEQYQTRGNIGPWTDVYALCATAYCCMTGQVPPSATDRVSHPKDASCFSAIPGLTSHQAKVLDRGMSVQIEDRYATVAALKRDLFSGRQMENTRKRNWNVLAAAAALAALLLILVPKSESPGRDDSQPSQDSHSHMWLEADCTDPKRCAACGITAGSPLGHQWQDATCTTPKTCSVCSAAEGIPLGHTWVAATTSTPKNCSYCGITEGDVLVIEDIYLNTMDYVNHYGKIWTSGLYETKYRTNADASDMNTPGHMMDTPRDHLGNTYQYGLHLDLAGPAAPYYITYELDGKYRTFTGVCSLASELRGTTSSKYFEVYCDGVLVFTSNTMTGTSAPQTFSIDVSGVDILRIQWPATKGANSIAVLFDGKLGG